MKYVRYVQPKGRRRIQGILSFTQRQGTAEEGRPSPLGERRCGENAPRRGDSLLGHQQGLVNILARTGSKGVTRMLHLAGTGYRGYLHALFRH